MIIEEPAFTIKPSNISTIGSREIYHFETSNVNIDSETVTAFGDEWSKFNSFSDKEINEIASKHYFDIVPDSYILGKRLLDVGCGTGRWTRYAAQFAESVDAVDPSRAIEAAANLLSNCKNVRLSQASVNDLPFSENSFDFVFSLGVLHHIPNTQLAMKQCVEKLKPGGHFLTYLYYNFDNRSLLFKSIFNISTLVRKSTCHLPAKLKDWTCDALAVVVYMPFIFLGQAFRAAGMPSVAKKLPLHFYLDKTFNVIRNDSRDRFGTPLEQRFTKEEIRLMMMEAGLTDIIFSDNEPYWHAIGKKK